MAIDTTPPPGAFHVTGVTARPIVPEEEAQWDELMKEVHPLGNAHFAGHRIKYVAELRGSCAFQRDVLPRGRLAAGGPDTGIPP